MDILELLNDGLDTYEIRDCESQHLFMALSDLEAVEHPNKTEAIDDIMAELERRGDL